MLKLSSPIYLLVFLFALSANAQQRPLPNTVTNGAPQNGSAEMVFATAASKVVFIITRKSGELHASASGVILSPDGYIGTNYHALQAADTVEVRFFADPANSGDYQSFGTAKLLYADSERDIAILKVNSSALPFFTCSTSSTCEARIGENVYAIGNPKGLTNTISEGIVSALRADDSENIIQHTAPISPGSSGGALVDSNGNLLGMNSWQLTNGQNLNFAISMKHLLTALAAAQKTSVSLSFPPETSSEPATNEQTNSTKANALSQMRRIVDAIKQCPEESFAIDVAVIRRHSPRILEWDVLIPDSNSVRAPFQGYVRFDIPKDAQETEEAKRSSELNRKFIEGLRGGVLTFPFSEYSYEFYLAPDRVDLKRAFFNLHIPYSQQELKPYEPSPQGSCWDRIASSPQSVEASSGAPAASDTSTVWNRTAIRADFREISATNEKDRIGFWYTLTNTTDMDYRINDLNDVTTAGWIADDSLYAFNQAVRFDVPLMIPAHQKATVMLNVGFAMNDPGTIPFTAAQAAYQSKVIDFIRSQYSALRGFAILDARSRYRIDFALVSR